MTIEENLQEDVQLEEEDSCLMSEMPYRGLALDGLGLRVLTNFDVAHDEKGTVYLNLGTEEVPYFMSSALQPVIQILYLYAETCGMDLCPCEMAMLMENIEDHARQFGDLVDPKNHEEQPDEAA